MIGCGYPSSLVYYEYECWNFAPKTDGTELWVLSLSWSCN